MQTLMVEKSTNDTNIMVDKINNNNNTNNFSGVSQSVNGGLNHQPMVENISKQWSRKSPTNGTKSQKQWSPKYQPQQYEPLLWQISNYMY